MTVTTPEELLPLWPLALQVVDHASGMIRRYKSAIKSFQAWYEQEARRPLTLITWDGYGDFVQRTWARVTSIVNGNVSVLHSWCAWLAEQNYLEHNPAKRIKLVGRQEASLRKGLSDIQVISLLRHIQSSERDATRNDAIVLLLLQAGTRLLWFSQKDERLTTSTMHHQKAQVSHVHST